MKMEIVWIKKRFWQCGELCTMQPCNWTVAKEKPNVQSPELWDRVALLPIED